MHTRNTAVLLLLVVIVAGCKKEKKTEPLTINGEEVKLVDYQLRDVVISDQMLTGWVGNKKTLTLASGYGFLAWGISGVLALVVIAVLPDLGKTGQRGPTLLGIAFCLSGIAGIYWFHHYPRLNGLLKEVNEYNILVRNLDVVVQLQKAGNNVELQNKSETLAALRETRNQLRIAIDTHRILRENPHFDAEQIAENVGLRATTSTRLQEEAGQLSGILNESVQIQRRVQSKLRALLKKTGDADLIPVES